jgi:hypothetical protein
VAKARIVTLDGAKVDIDGTPGEIAALLRTLKVGTATSAHSMTSTKAAAAPRRRTTRPTLPRLIAELIEAKFFAKPKGIAEIRARLADLGHHYPVTSMSGPLQDLARQRKLRRFKKDGKYIYAQ